ncbi:MAG: MinD/ParA family protein [Anaerolineales bacterium]|nr:MinD/ParA family protein [Anaerolineales bacterium]
MSRVIVVHSFRRASGKSSLVANLGVLLAQQGKRVALIDADFQGPSLHLFFGLPETEIHWTLNDCLMGECDILQVVCDISDRLGADGKLFLIPASTQVNEILGTLRQSFDFDKINEGLRKLNKDHDLDYVILDTNAGLNENTLTAIALANDLVVLLRPDQQDYQGTAVTVEVAHSLGMQCQFVVLNDIPDTFDRESAWKELESTYGCRVGALLPHSEELMAMASARVLALAQPQDPYVINLRQLALQLLD